jgi:hypothetical protein
MRSIVLLRPRESGPMKSDRYLAIEATAQDLVADFLYYGRKEDEDLPLGAIQEAISEGEITVEDIIEIFSKELRDKIDWRTNERT